MEVKVVVVVHVRSPARAVQERRVLVVIVALTIHVVEDSTKIEALAGIVRIERLEVVVTGRLRAAPVVR